MPQVLKILFVIDLKEINNEQKIKLKEKFGKKFTNWHKQTKKIY